jgi:hypothetical protein
MRRLAIFILMCVGICCYAQFTPTPGGAYKFAGGVWAPATSTTSGGTPGFTPTPIGLYCYNGTNWVPADSTCLGGGMGTVTSVTFTGDGILDSSTPSTAVTTSGTVTATPLTQSANLLLAGPASGAAANPTFRALVNADFLNTLAPTFSGANLTSLPAAAAGSLTGTTLASNVVTSSLTSASGGSFGTAAYSNTGTSGATIPLRHRHLRPFTPGRPFPETALRVTV